MTTLAYTKPKGTFINYRLLVFLCLLLLFFQGFPAILTAETAVAGVHTIELNFVFLHGMGGSPCALQRLSDWIKKTVGNYIYVYQQTYPDTKFEINTLSRCYPGYASIDEWANNIADSIEDHFAGRDNLILVGHSMGGKTALYMVANDVRGMRDKVAAVITINSPIKKLADYYVPGGGPVVNYCQTVLLGSDEGVCMSVTHYDSSLDGKWVGENKHWLAFVSAENAPLSLQFDRTGVDPWPRDMDDGVVPISAQYADGADIVYYGEYEHSEFSTSDAVSETLANYIMRYLFGYSIECAVLLDQGTFEHEADWLLGKDHWDEIYGEVLVDEGVVNFRNESFFRWADWEEIVGELIPGDRRSSAVIRQTSIPLLSNIREARWLTTDNPEDARIYLNLSAAPRTTIEVEWAIYLTPLLPETTPRGFYEVYITDGTPLVAITRTSWATDDPRDPRIRVWSEAHSPFRWFTAEWRTYYLETRQKNIVSEIAGHVSIY